MIRAEIYASQLCNINLILSRIIPNGRISLTFLTLFLLSSRPISNEAISPSLPNYRQAFLCSSTTTSLLLNVQPEGTEVAKNDSGDNNYNNNTDPTTFVIRKVLDQLKGSSFIEEKHQEHCDSPSVTHLFKGTPLAKLPNEYKLSFVDSWAGNALERIMREEQAYLGDWKIHKILEAAGSYPVEEVRELIDSQIDSNPVVIYSFVDCPWCLAAKELLSMETYASVPKTIIELESLGHLGKEIRAELSKMTGRTSMPCIFLGGQPIGGFTDGAPCGPGLKELHNAGKLESTLESLGISS